VVADLSSQHFHFVGVVAYLSQAVVADWSRDSQHIGQETVSILVKRQSAYWSRDSQHIGQETVSILVKRQSAHWSTNSHYSTEVAVLSPVADWSSDGRSIGQIMLLLVAPKGLYTRST